jgi:predicted nucleic acid-binding protein
MRFAIGARKTVSPPSTPACSVSRQPAPDARVVGWLRANERDLVVDPIVLGEVRFGILLLPRGKRRNRLEQWFDHGVGRLHCIAWEAVTGLRGRLTVVTRNVTDFSKAQVRVVDPFIA